MKVKIFLSKDIKKLEDMINKWLESGYIIKLTNLSENQEIWTIVIYYEPFGIE